jgi:hypothetical protein
MATDKLKCSACGFGALLFRTGESTKLTVDSAKQIQVCHHFRHDPQTKGRRAAPLDCRNFREAIQAPVDARNGGTPNSVESAEGEGLGTTQAAADKPQKVAPSRRSRGAEVAETGAGSPKATSTRRPSKKSAGGRSTRSKPPIVAAGVPTVS